VHFKNQEASPGLKRGGALNIALHEVEIMVTADSIPEELVADLTGLDIGSSIHASGAVNLPKGATTTDKTDFVVASITGLLGQISEEAGEGAAGEPAAAGEESRSARPPKNSADSGWPRKPRGQVPATTATTSASMAMNAISRRWGFKPARARFSSLTRPRARFRRPMGR